MGVKIYSAISKNIRIRENGAFTAPTLISDAGVFFEEAGGYYAGGNILVDGKEYAVFVEPLYGTIPITTEYFSSTPYRVEGSASPYNGRQNTQNMLLNYNISTIPAVKYCTDLTTNGFSDWHLPSIEELDICYRYLKPTTETNFVDGSLSAYAFRSINQYSNPYGEEYTANDPSQTTVPEFKIGNSEAFHIGDGTGDNRFYLSSSITPVSTTGWDLYIQTFSNGFPSKFDQTNTDGRPCRVRAVRWMEV